MSNLFIFAPSLRSSGGLQILSQAITSQSSDFEKIFVFSPSLPLDLPHNSHLSLVFTPTHNIITHLRAQYFIYCHSTCLDTCLCLSNYPPFLNINARIVLFLHNRLLFEPNIKYYLPLAARLTLYYKRCLLLLLARRINLLLVQTDSFLQLVKPFFPRHTILLFNFPISISTRYSRSMLTKANGQTTFFYPASCELHKNHQNLILAWIQLHTLYSIRAQLVLTVSLSNLIPLFNKDNLHTLSFLISNGLLSLVGPLNHNQVIDIYSYCDCIIYPSFCESLGLPLLESKIFGLDLLAADLPYVYDSITPTDVFCPYSVDSILYSLHRYLQLPATPKPTSSSVSLFCLTQSH